MENILDADLEQELSVLSNFQLVGFLNTNIKYDSRILESVNTEISRRKLSEIEIETIAMKYNQVELIQKGQFKISITNKLLLIISLLFVIFSLGFLAGVITNIIICFSILTIKVKSEKGKSFENRLWNKFSIVISVSFCLLISIVILKNII